MSTVGDVALVTITDRMAGGVWAVTHVTITGQGVVTDAYAPGPPGPTGAPGPNGPAGLVRVNHGADASVARPGSPVVLWVGSADPVNANEETDLIVRIT